jgi:uncharacterized protein YndB with AHSA1/START domain
LNIERKTKIHAEDGKHEIVITREFDLPVELLFRAHTEAEIFEEWMTHEYATVKVVKWDQKQHGGWRFETRDKDGNMVFGANGVFHKIVADRSITRTFEMENSPFDVQLDFLEFERLSDERSKLTMHSVYRSVEIRDQLLKLPFAQGLNMAHDRLQDVLKKIK